MNRNFKIVVEYDGTYYYGWQRQEEKPTIQAEIERTLCLITHQPIVVIGSGRTDAGVHAIGQSASFHCDTNLTPDIIQRALNGLLPKDIVIRECMEMSRKFHARFDVISKTYHYRILNQRIPSAMERHFAWHIQNTLEVDAMQKALNYLVGTHDFKAFEGSGSPRAHTIRTIHQADILKKENSLWCVVINGNGFLRYMVRNIVGTLVRIGLKKKQPEEMKSILLSKDRSMAAATAPAHGLFLVEVRYE
jgi:tRNA pseudouridine38-40 synthase